MGENLDFIKQELSNEEKLLESVIKAEKFYKRYKKPLIAIVGVCIVFIVGYMGYDWKKEHDKEVANSAYNALLHNPDNKEAMQTLKRKNPKLYMLYLYQKGLKDQDIKTLQTVAQSSDPILSDLAKYHIAVLKEDESKLHRYTMSAGAVMRDLAFLDDAFMLMKEGKITVAKKRLESVDAHSLALPYAKLLRHYGIKGKR